MLLPLLAWKIPCGRRCHTPPTSHSAHHCIDGISILYYYNWSIGRLDDKLAVFNEMNVLADACQRIRLSHYLAVVVVAIRFHPQAAKHYSHLSIQSDSKYTLIAPTYALHESVLLCYIHHLSTPFHSSLLLLRIACQRVCSKFEIKTSITEYCRQLLDSNQWNHRKFSQVHQLFFISRFHHAAKAPQNHKSNQIQCMQVHKHFRFSYHFLLRKHILLSCNFRQGIWCSWMGCQQNQSY